VKKSLKLIPVCALALFLLASCVLAPAASAESLSAAEIEISVSKRDASGEYDASEATALSPNDDLTITEAGVYILSGSYENVMIVIDAGEEDKVQLVLENAAISNESGPAIYVRSADKVFLTAAEGTVNSISDGADYTLTDEDTTLDAAVFSRADLTINGAGTLTIAGNCKHAVVSKDDLVVTAKDLTVIAANVGLNGKDSVTLSEAALVVTAGSDGVRAENGSILVDSGAYTIKASSDGVAAAEMVGISGGSFDITAAEGVEATYVLISGGEIAITASDDGINAARKSDSYTPTVEITGGTITITMGAGDTDGVDSNGNIIISGGTVSVNGSSSFDYDGTASFTGGTVYVNGQQVTTLPNQMMGGGMGGFGGGMGGDPGAQGGFGGGPGGGRP